MKSAIFAILLVEGGILFHAGVPVGALAQNCVVVAESPETTSIP